MAQTPDRPAGHPAQATLEVAKASIGFSAAHFSILESGAERLHGHNYGVGLRVRGSVGEDGTLVDFGVLKQALRAECDQLDHRMLIPVDCPGVRVRERADGHVELDEGDRHFLFPAGDVRLLPVRNTTCECLAAHLLAAVRARLGPLPVALEVTVEESPGQGATVVEQVPARGL